FYEDKDHAYVVISEGCSNFCSYCVVPYVRGPLRNRNHKDIIREIEEAADKGITKITLLGQNVNAYGDDKVTFGTLLNLINNIKVLKEFTFVTSHPKDTSTDLFKAIAGIEKLKKCLHLPMQSGSDRILKLMNRGYTKRHYLDLVENYKRLNPKGLLSTDIIVGFPAESEKEFLETYELMKRVKFDAAYLFKYSPRPNTRAETLPDDVPKKEKERRHKCLLDFQRDLWRKSQKVAACSFVVLWFLSQTVLCWAALDIFGHSKTLRAKKKVARKQVQEKLLDYPKECILMGNYQEAFNKCRELIDYPSVQKRRAEILYLAGLCCLKLGRNIEARSYFNEAILAEGENENVKAEAYLGVADSYFLNERFDEASDAYERVLTNYPKDSIKVMAYYRLGEISYKIGQPGRAEYYLSKLTQEFPLSFESRLLKNLLNEETPYVANIDSTNTYSIQVGCFANKGNADKICEKLSKEGFDVYILESPYSDEPKFKVRVGRVNSKNDAGILEARLKGAGYPTRICP
ncbi:MAG: MiaB/RimO family radical SAM methylthiotransferase, partial [Candidatus Omnitrophica bacterium]|nr:MiaB/RimO family radical SAM methylthiotransferase [Candidatus Omnitrophota bacterium]